MNPEKENQKKQLIEMMDVLKRLKNK